MSYLITVYANTIPSGGMGQPCRVIGHINKFLFVSKVPNLIVVVRYVYMGISSASKECSYYVPAGSCPNMKSLRLKTIGHFKSVNQKVSLNCEIVKIVDNL